MQKEMREREKGSKKEHENKVWEGYGNGMGKIWERYGEGMVEVW